MGIEPIPFKEGEPPPSDKHILANVKHEDGSPDQLMWILPRILQKSAPRHEDVDALLPVLRWQWRHIGQYATWCRSFEDWELGFMRDADPGGEVAIFTQATYAFLQFAMLNPKVDRSTVFAAVVEIINGRVDKVQPATVAKTLEKLLVSAPDYLADSNNFTADGKLTTGAFHLR